MINHKFTRVLWKVSRTKSKDQIDFRRRNRVNYGIKQKNWNIQMWSILVIGMILTHLILEEWFTRSIQILISLVHWHLKKWRYSYLISSKSRLILIWWTIWWVFKILWRLRCTRNRRRQHLPFRISIRTTLNPKRSIKSDSIILIFILVMFMNH